MRTHIRHINLIDNDNVPISPGLLDENGMLGVQKLWTEKVSGEGSRPPSVSGSIQLSTLPVGPELSFRLFGLAPVGSRRFTRSMTIVTAEQIILGHGCVVSAPLPWLSPGRSRDPPFSWRGDLPQLGVNPTVGRPPSPDGFS